jgi:hypothetical protein
MPIDLNDSILAPAIAVLILAALALWVPILSLCFNVYRQRRRTPVKSILHEPARATRADIEKAA